MIYYANGCSYTWGGSLFNFDHYNVWLPDQPASHPFNQKRLKTVYPYHLGQLINADEVINDSLGAGSNYRIVRTTLDYFHNLLLQDKDISNHFVTIQWTEPSRYEYYSETNKSWALLTPASMLYEHKVSNNSQVLNDHEYYYKNFNSNIQDIKTYIQHVTTLGNFFKVHNIPYLFFKHTGWDYIYQKNQLEYTKLLSQFNWLKDDPLVYNMLASNIDTVIGSHPSELGHKQWADILFNEIKRKNLL